MNENRVRFISIRRTAVFWIVCHTFHKYRYWQSGYMESRRVSNIKLTYILEFEYQAGCLDLAAKSLSNERLSISDISPVLYTPPRRNVKELRLYKNYCCIRSALQCLFRVFTVFAVLGRSVCIGMLPRGQCCQSTEFLYSAKIRPISPSILIYCFYLLLYFKPRIFRHVPGNGRHYLRKV